MTDTRVSADTRAMMAYDASKKSTSTAYLLWFFLGGFGAHRFYLGHTGVAVAQLLLTLVGIALAIFAVGFLLLIPVWIWLIVDAFMIPKMVRELNEKLAVQMGMV